MAPAFVRRGRFSFRARYNETMALATPLALSTIQEYLDFEETTPDKHELFRGRIYAMAGGSSNHGNVIDSLTQVCIEALRGRKPCRFVGSSRKLVIEATGSGYYPDAVIASPLNDLNPRQGSYDNPTVVFEVLSPGTGRFDRTDKYDDYRSLPSLRDYVLVESEVARVEVFSRSDDGGWLHRVYLPGTIAHLPSVGIDLPLDELYENAVFDDRPRSPLEES